MDYLEMSRDLIPDIRKLSPRARLLLAIAVVSLTVAAKYIQDRLDQDS